MGFFNKHSRAEDLVNQHMGDEDIELTSKSALALAVMTLIGVGEPKEYEEISILKRIVRGDKDAVVQAFKVYKDKSVEECMCIVNNSLKDRTQKAAVIANLFDIAAAQGILDDAEEDLMKYAEVFEIPDELLKNIVGIMSLKNYKFPG